MEPLKTASIIGPLPDNSKKRQNELWPSFS